MINVGIAGGGLVGVGGGCSAASAARAVNRCGCEKRSGTRRRFHGPAASRRRRHTPTHAQTYVMMIVIMINNDNNNNNNNNNNNYYK